jgi:hypothetical protein
MTPILEAWDAWAKENGRPDIRKAVWRIFDLFQGIRYPGQMETIKGFLGGLKESPELATLKQAIDKATQQDASPQEDPPLKVPLGQLAL